MHNVILTGIPRSGTTLAAALIDSLPDTVCLNEPAWQTARVARDAQGFAEWLAGDFAQLRQKLLRGEAVPDRREADGSAVTNYYRAEAGKMEHTFKVIPFARAELTQDFTLAIKHNGPYLAALKPLVESKAYTIIAIVRHPVEVIASWRRLALPISQGRMPNATPYWPRMAQLVASPMDMLEKQVRMYDLMCKRIWDMRESIHVLPYETMVKSPGVIANYLVPGGAPVAPLVAKPQRDIPQQEKEAIVQALKAHGEFTRHFYPSEAL